MIVRILTIWLKKIKTKHFYFSLKNKCFRKIIGVNKLILEFFYYIFKVKIIGMYLKLDRYFLPNFLKTLNINDRVTYY